VDDPTRPLDPGTYGRSFADVYDRWYPADDDTTAAVARITSLAGPGGSVLELGIGTGRLALPLAAAGLPVTGIDSSPEMLERHLAKDGADGIVVCPGDVADADAWPAGPFRVVVAAFNLLLNLPDDDAQAATVALAASRLAPGGHLVVEAVLPAPLDRRERRVEVREVADDVVVLIATDADPDTGLVLGQHVELRDGQPVRLRPWRVRMAGPDDTDRWAAAAGLELVDRHGDWAGAPFGPHGPRHVSCYRRPA
jgi:SAM-dependent methyltransferase